MSNMEQSPLATPQCAHFWMIESPRGPYSSGLCKYCGEARAFRNSLPLSRWDGEVDKGSIPAVPIVAPQP
ncbi:MAG: hypothetical protein EXR55_04075 [Dehalococcoidia bacterium]|nr:hypothetical protein [Dehalococcoidia bacterium]